VQLCYLVEASGSEQEEQDAETRLYQAYVRPFLLKRRDERRKEGGTALMALSQGQVVSAEGQEFGVRALDPIARCGALDESTAVFISHIETAALDRVHVLPYGDSLPSAYEFDLFRDFLRPFFQSHPFEIFRRGDVFTYQGVRFRVMATDPAAAAARVGNQTMVFCEGDPLRPTLLEQMPAEVQDEFRRLPRGLQMLLLSSMASQESVQGRIAEAHEALRPGQGLGPAQIDSVGRTVTWRAAERGRDAQSQCMVCLADFTEGETLRQLNCDHLFHAPCVDEWLSRSAVCPICKQPAGGERPASGDIGEGAALLNAASVVCEGNQYGRVVGFEAAQQKFVVSMEDGGERLVAADEMVQTLKAVHLVGLRAQEYNGRRAQIVGIDAARCRYQVCVGAGSHAVISVKPENCILPNDAVARVVGLSDSSAGARWNGHYGRVVGYQNDRGRHVLAMQPRGELLLVRPKNLRA